jgi:hypothetical protein
MTVAPVAGVALAPPPTPEPIPAPSPAPVETPAPSLTQGAVTRVRVQGNKLVDARGRPLILRGVHRAGTEYACIQGWGIGEGPRDQASIEAIKSWNVNVVRIGLNEDCWLGINGVLPQYSGAPYREAVSDFVQLFNQNGVYVILELHFSAPGTTPATGQVPMPDMDHSPEFWTQVSTAFKGRDAVIFEPFNEPHPDSNRDTAAAWTCWRDGGTCPGVPYQVAGMQTLVNAIRATGATNVIALGGVQYSNSLTQWLAYRPTDPLNNLAASWHVYNFTLCSFVTCYEATAAKVLAEVPLLATEIGDITCEPGFLEALMNWLDSKQSGYLAFTWNVWGRTCRSWSLILDWDGTPTTKGQTYRAHLVGP